MPGQFQCLALGTRWLLELFPEAGEGVPLGDVEALWRLWWEFNYLILEFLSLIWHSPLCRAFRKASRHELKGTYQRRDLEKCKCESHHRADSFQSHGNRCAPLGKKWVKKTRNPHIQKSTNSPEFYFKGGLALYLFMPRHPLVMALLSETQPTGSHRAPAPALPWDGTHTVRP